MIKKTLYGSEAREKVLLGIEKIVDAVAVTLGPKGRNAVISEAAIVDYGTYNFPLRVTKDGVSVAKAFDVDDPFEKVGVMLVKEAAEKTVMQAGDGTTTCCVLLRAIVREGMRLINEGANPMELKRGIDNAVEHVVSELAKMAVPVKGDVEKIRQIATVSANNDSSIGDLIAQAFEKIGEEGIIDIEPSKSVKTEIKITEGYKFGKGWISPLFINKKEKQVCEFENPLFLLYDKRVTHHTQVQKALEISMQQGRPIVIICEDADQEGLAFLALNNAQGRVQCCVVSAPEYGDARRESMEDIATIADGTYLSDTKGYSIKEVTLTQLGGAAKVIISKDETIIIGGDGDAVDTLNELRMNLAEAKSEDEKAPIEKRIAKLTGGVAVIQVGAATETEMKERLDRFDDAVKATKAAVAEGYVAGAGTAFLRMKGSGVWVDLDALEAVGKMTTSELLKQFNDTGIMLNKGGDILSVKGESKGESVLRDALLTPLMQIVGNGGKDAVLITKMVLSQGGTFGYNAKTDKVEDLLVAGIIDPAKVLRCALQNAASAAGNVLTSEVLIVDTF